MRPRALALALLAFGGLFGTGHPGAAAGDIQVVVTSSDDSVVAGESVCPHASKCTLRRAIELVNAYTSDGAATITFDPAAFDPGTGGAIDVLATPLPPVTRDGVTIDGTGASVHLDGKTLAEAGDGLVMRGASGIVRAIAVHGFAGACITLSGGGGLATGNAVGDCATGIVVTGESSAVRGNKVGFTAGGEPSATTIGVLVLARGARVGDASTGPSAANTLGNAATGVLVGEPSGAEINDIEVAGNILGKAPSGSAAPLGAGIVVQPPAMGVRIVANTIANAGSAVVIAHGGGDAKSAGNVISGNRFEAIGGQSIDLGGNGIRELNDADDTDTGPNDLLNHPVISRAVQSRIQGTACAGCRVELYMAAHTPGGQFDYGTNPIAGGIFTASESGFFEWNAPPLSPGQWIVALAIDEAGNTSEFSPSSRVGAGVAQCGNLALVHGWNLIGYFGQASFPLGNMFPPDGSETSKVSAIYRLLDGSTNYQAWFNNGGLGRTLNTLESGEAYWMYAGQPASISGGFSLTVSLPVALKAGWNEFVYIGAPVDPRDALASIAGKYTAVYRWENGPEARWRAFDPALPAWAQGVQTFDSCGAYSIFVTEDTTLTPPQP